MASNLNGDFYFLNCLLSFRSEEKRNFHDNVCKNNKYCQIIMQNDKHNILDYCHGMKSIRHSFFIYDDFELMHEKMDDCDNDTKECITTNGKKHASCGIFNFIKLSFDKSKNKNFFYGSSNCTK